ncbi:MAG: SH3 domain-containing protein [Devosia sp.]
MLTSTASRIAALALVGLLGTTVAAFAADDPAVTTSAANLRTGPGLTYSVITSLPAGTDVTVHACTATWCALTTDDDDEGFVAKSLLDFDVGPSPSDEAAEVCFYQGPNFTGPNFCVEPGDSDDHIPGNYNNAIESILVTGDAVVEVCTGVGMHGACDSFDSSAKKLPPVLRDQISSYAVDNGDGTGGGDDGQIGGPDSADVTTDDGSIGITLN